MTTEIGCDWSLLTAPVMEPITLDEAKQQCSVFHADDNALITAFVKAARGAAESYLNRALLTQTWKMELESFADRIWLPMAGYLQNSAPDSTVPVVQYYDTDGTLQTLSSSYYTVDRVSEPGSLRKSFLAWPALYAFNTRPVVITYTCGWTSADDVPELIKQGIRLYLAWLYGDRTGDASAEASRKAAEACWRAAGQVFWRPPEVCAAMAAY